jgi:hypothetical protein
MSYKDPATRQTWYERNKARLSERRRQRIHQARAQVYMEGLTDEEAMLNEWACGDLPDEPTTLDPSMISEGEEEIREDSFLWFLLQTETE